MTSTPDAFHIREAVAYFDASKELEEAIDELLSSGFDRARQSPFRVPCWPLPPTLGLCTRRSKTPARRPSVPLPEGAGSPPQPLCEAGSNWAGS